MPRQPDPRPGSRPVYPELMESLERQAGIPGTAAHAAMPYLADLLRVRVAEGRQKYGTVLEAHNGRDAILDAWEENADLCFYLQQALMEGDRVERHLETAFRLLFDLTRLRRSIEAREEVPA